ncbi:integration host factor, actinobacterial type [Streptomyces prunicolor]|uniref:integration host factor, actinobacterial type n=1 Tax=Streptomyces prunicolor TaxID=67348 RepID=UPI00035F3E05|nr:integration host factor, actinobacterial type [Streptomyces prunicolor]
MSLPSLTPEQRAAALEKAAASRRERALVLTELKQGRRSLRELLDSDSPTVRRTHVRKMLESLPGIGKVRAGQLMTEFDIASSRRVQGLGARQKRLLLERLGTAAA